MIQIDVYDKHPIRNSCTTNVETGACVFRKFINSAVYVEKSMNKMEMDYRDKFLNYKIVRTKRCCCAIDSKDCSFHSPRTIVTKELINDRKINGYSFKSPSIIYNNKLQDCKSGGIGNGLILEANIREINVKKDDSFLKNEIDIKNGEWKQSQKIEQNGKIKESNFIHKSDEECKHSLKAKQCEKSVENYDKNNSNDELKHYPKIEENNQFDDIQFTNKSKEEEANSPKLYQNNNSDENYIKNNENEEFKDSQKIEQTQKKCTNDILENTEYKDEQIFNTYSKTSCFVCDDEQENNYSSPTSSTLTQTTVKPGKANSCLKSDSKLSLASLTSFSQSNEMVRQWLAKKIEEKKKQEMKRAMELERKEKERQQILEKERENFKNWLAAKKKHEEIKKTEQFKLQKMEHLKELQKEKRQLENEISYHIWLKKKQDMYLDKKKMEHQKSFQEKLEKEERLKANQNAFEDWFKTSKNKPKPVPLNQGINSMRLCTSVTYVNPIPWTPNIIDRKSSSQ